MGNAQAGIGLHEGFGAGLRATVVQTVARRWLARRSVGLARRQTTCSAPPCAGVLRLMLEGAELTRGAAPRLSNMRHLPSSSR